MTEAMSNWSRLVRKECPSHGAMMVRECLGVCPVCGQKLEKAVAWYTSAVFEHIAKQYRRGCVSWTMIQGMTALNPIWAEACCQHCGVVTVDKSRSVACPKCGRQTYLYRLEVKTNGNTDE